MKKNIWKLVVLLLLIALCCRITLMGVYPFLAILFFAAYMEDFYRTPLLAFTYLFMVLWLPMADLFRYGIIFLVWMVCLGIADRMQLRRRGFLQALFGGVITLLVSYGGQVLSNHDKKWNLLPLLEGMLVAGASFFTYRILGVFLQWQPGIFVKQRVAVTGQQMQGYQQAMADLSRRLQYIMEESAAPPMGSVWKMRQELQHKICRFCDKQEECLVGNEGMELALTELMQSVEQGQPIEEQTRQQIFRQCERAELLMQEVTNVFEKIELNQSWYGRLCEHRELIAGEIDTMAMVMEDCMEQETLLDDKETWRMMQLRFRLREVGIRASHVHLFQRKNGAWKLTMQLAAGWGRIVTAGELLPCINACFPHPFINAPENRGIVGREKNTYVFFTETKLECTYGVAKMIQEGQQISGDSFRAKEMEDGRFVMALSDGMGSGEQANRESESVVDLLLGFVEAGFTMEVTLRMMNAAMIFGAEKERFSTLDVCLVDGHTGIADIYKVGAHVSFIKHKNSVEIVDAASLPMGAGTKVDTIPNRGFLASGDMLVMVTDGVLEYLHVSDPVETLQTLLLEMSESDAATFSRKIMERILLFTGGKVQDDMTILTLKAQER